MFTPKHHSTLPIKHLNYAMQKSPWRDKEDVFSFAYDTNNCSYLLFWICWLIWCISRLWATHKTQRIWFLLVCTKTCLLFVFQYKFGMFQDCVMMFIYVWFGKFDDIKVALHQMGLWFSLELSSLSLVCVHDNTCQYGIKIIHLI